MNLKDVKKVFLLSTIVITLANFGYAENTSLKTQRTGATNHSTWINDYIHPVADFPQSGIQFQWYAHLLREPRAFHRAIQEFADRYRNSEIEAIAGLDARGFIFGAALAYELNLPFVLIRKSGKLPGDVVKINYDLEYGKDSLEIERNSLLPGQKVLVIDDVLATGGTAETACKLVEQIGAEVVEVACLIELPILKGRERLCYPVFSLITIDVE